MDEMSDFKDVKIKELEDTIKVLMEKLAVCGDGQMNGVNGNDEDLEEDTIEQTDLSIDEEKTICN